MRIKNWWILTFPALLIFGIGNGSIAGGPMHVVEGKPATWASSGQPIPYRIDGGNCGAFNADDIKDMVADAFDAWSSIKSACVPRFVAQDLGHDVKMANEVKALDQDRNAGNLVLFDDDGEILEQRNYPGAKEDILGWAQPYLEGGRIVRFVSLFNGHLAKKDKEIEFKETIVHEFGHAIGLDHSQINWELAEKHQRAKFGEIPTMFPTSALGIGDLDRLSYDDIAWASELYPCDERSKVHGVIYGKLVFAKDPTKPVRGSNVVAVNKKNPMIRFSGTSCWLMDDEGCFRIPVLPGIYEIFAEPIRGEFNGVSSVGQFARDVTAKAFTEPIIYTTYPGPAAEVDFAKQKPAHDLGVFKADAPKRD